MKEKNKKEIELYFKQIKLLFPIYGKYEKRFLCDLKTTVSEYREEYPNDGIKEIQQRFGSPQDIVHNYLRSMDPSVLYRKLSLRRCLKRILVAAVILTIIAFCVYVGTIYKVYLDAQNQLVTKEVTVIE